MRIFFPDIYFIVGQMIDFSVVFVPLTQEADDGVEKQDEEQEENEQLFATHFKLRSPNFKWRWKSFLFTS